MKANPKAIGAFVVGGVALLLAGIVTFGSFKFFEQRLPIVMYFEGNMTGLDVGAPVVFRGVRIGTVTDVTLHFNSNTRRTVIPVHAEIEPDRFSVEGELKGGGNIAPLVRDGLRAQLAAQSMLTGKLLVQLDLQPEYPANFVGDGKGAPEIPTVPSAMEQLQEGVEGVLKKIQDMPLAELTKDLRSLVQDADAAVKSLDARSFADAGAQAADAIREVRGLIANVNQRVDMLAPASESAIKNTDQMMVELQKRLVEARPLLATLQRTADSADRLMTNANGVIDPSSPLYRELVATLREFGNTARSVRALADDLERNPDSLVFGKASSGRTR